MTVFTKKFLDVDNSIIIKDVQEKGFFKFGDALTDEFISSVTNDVSNSGLSLNNNTVSGVYFTHGNQFFLTHMLAASKAFYNYCTNSKVLKNGLELQSQASQSSTTSMRIYIHYEHIQDKLDSLPSR